MMTIDTRRICSLCAWRENCTKRYMRGNDTSIHCADFSEDVILRKQRAAAEDEAAANDNIQKEL